MKIVIPTTDLVVDTNKYICQQQGHTFTVLDVNKIESAIHTAFYPGSQKKNNTVFIFPGMNRRCSYRTRGLGHE
ncbi:MAG: hypothetical protein HQK52_23185 [Oligoflexia bacterium]|nr:hypothetical protein [Oligoflexia bacterium]